MEGESIQYSEPERLCGEDEILPTLAELLTRASRRLRNNEKMELAPHGLTHTQAGTLRVLEREGTIRMGDLANILEIVPRSATTRVADLERVGLVERRVDPSDRRSILVGPTAAGQELVSRLIFERRAGAEQLFAPLSADERWQLLALLARLTEGTGR